MRAPIHSITKLAAILGVAAAVAVAVPIALALDGPPDAIDRYNNPAPLAWDGPPDAIDRYTGSDVLIVEPLRQGSPDAIDRYLGRTGAATVVVAEEEGFSWAEFGIGAGTAIGIVLLIAGLALGAVTFHHHHHGGGGTLRPS